MEFHPADVSSPIEVEVCTTEETILHTSGEPIALDTKCVNHSESPFLEEDVVDCRPKRKSPPTMSDEKSGVEKKILIIASA